MAPRDDEIAELGVPPVLPPVCIGTSSGVGEAADVMDEMPLRDHGSGADRDPRRV